MIDTGNIAVDCVDNLAVVLDPYKKDFNVLTIYTTRQDFSLEPNSLQIGFPNVESDDLTSDGYTQIELLMIYWHSELASDDREREIIESLDKMTRIIKQDSVRVKGQRKSALNTSGMELVSRGYGNAHFPPAFEIKQMEWWQGGLIVLNYRIPTILLSNTYP